MVGLVQQPLTNLCQVTQNPYELYFQHPVLTPGQKRFLYSIAEAYSKEHMRQLICQHYMNVLHRCIRTGEPSPLISMKLNFACISLLYKTFYYNEIYNLLYFIFSARCKCESADVNILPTSGAHDKLSKYIYEQDKSKRKEIFDLRESQENNFT